MLRKFSVVLVTPVLFLTSLAQPSLSQNSQPNLDKRLSLYSAPGVVRVVTGCFSEYSYWSPYSQPGDEPSRYLIRGNYPTDDPQKANNTGYTLGTGFFINSNGYIVTTASLVKTEVKNTNSEKIDLIDKETCRKHLVDQIAEQDFKSKDADFLKEFKDTLKSGNPFRRDVEIEIKGKPESREEKYQLKFEDVQYFHHIVLPNGQKVLFEYVGRRSESGGGGRSGKDVAILKIVINNAPTLKLASSDEVQVQERVGVLAYPPSAELEVDPDTAKEKNYKADVQIVKDLIRELKPVPTVINSYISSPPRKLSSGALILQVNGPVVYGTLGSPVLNEQNQVIGMVSHGREYTYVIPASTIRDFIGDAGTTNEQGQTDQVYHEGLNFYWQRDYNKAIKRFKDVKSFFPQHSEVDELIRQSDAAILTSDERFPVHWLALIAVGVGAALIAAVTAFLLGRRSSQPSSVPPVPVPPTGGTRKRGQPTPNGNNFRPITAISAKPFIKLTHQGQELIFELDDDICNLGRDPNWSDFKIPNEWEVISGRHATFQKEGDDYRIYDAIANNPAEMERSSTIPASTLQRVTF